MDNATQPSMHPTPSAAPAHGDGDLNGRTLGDFHLLRRLGQGGMGEVYLAEQVSLKRKVALKILKAELAANPSSLQRFKSEAENIARATHANIVQVYAINESDGLHYMALEYVEGRNLRDHLARKGPPDVLLALSIMRQVAAALQRASELGIIHRDIKPENILLTRKGEVKVADFGLSRCLAPDQQPLHLTQSGVAMGTPLYMSPEQVEGRPVDPRTDIYSFGVTCYHMLAGQPPFHGATAFSVAMQHVQAEAIPLESVRPDLPIELCGIVRKMMAKEPEKRHQTANELLKDLLRLRENLTGVAASLQTQPVALEPSSSLSALSTPTLPTTARPRRWLRWAIAASVLIALAGGAAFGWLRHSWRSPAPSAGVMSNPDREKMEAIEAMFSPQKREAKLLADVDKYGYIGPDRTRMQPALGAYLDLGLFYLEQWRLDDAEHYFAKLNNPKYPPQYQFLGQLGHAMLLAFQDRTRESNDLFVKLLGKKPDGDRAEFVVLQQRNPQLRPMLARALDYNAINATSDAPFPKQLEQLRKPPPPRRPAADKPPAKGA